MSFWKRINKLLRVRNKPNVKHGPTIINGDKKIDTGLDKVNFFANLLYKNLYKLPRELNDFNPVFKLGLFIVKLSITDNMTFIPLIC